VSKRRLTNVEPTGHVSIDQAPPLFELHVMDRSARGNSCIAEEAVDFAKLLCHVSAPVLDRNAIPHVNYRAYCFSSVASNHAASFFKPAFTKIA